MSGRGRGAGRSGARSGGRNGGSGAGTARPGGSAPGAPSGGGRRGHGAIRRSQVISTWGPGALLDLPTHSVIMGGLETWPPTTMLEPIDEPRLARKLVAPGQPVPGLFAPPRPPEQSWMPATGVGSWLFPEWFVVREDPTPGRVSRRLVNRRALDDRRRFEGRPVVATRFVGACPKGHIDDIDWYFFVHGAGSTCRRQLWLDELGTGGDLSDLVVRCECTTQRRLIEAQRPELKALGMCRGTRPWLGPNTREAGCTHATRLLNRFAANVFFPQVQSVLSLPDTGTAIERAITPHMAILTVATDATLLGAYRHIPALTADLAPFTDGELLAAIGQARIAGGSPADRPIKLVELDAILDAPGGYGDDLPIDGTFHARRLPRDTWHRDSRYDAIEAVVQVHRLREVTALLGFTRFEAFTADILGEYGSDVERAAIAVTPTWYPAIERRGEGIFLQIRADAIAGWLARPAVATRIDALLAGQAKWRAERNVVHPHPGGPYVFLHTLAHLLISSLAVRCGYPASALHERIYVDVDGDRYGILVYTSTADADGTLGGLVQQAHAIEEHLADALRAGALCSSDPVCAYHDPASSLEQRWLHGAACHGCTLIGETSCEMRNDHLDRALVIPVIGTREASFVPAHA